MPRENTCIFAGMSSRCRARAFTFSAIIKSSAREISGEVRPGGRCESGKAKSEWWKKYASSVDRERLLERLWTASIRIGRRVGRIQFARRSDRFRAPLSSRITRRLRLRNSSWMTGVEPLSKYKESIERGEQVVDKFNDLIGRESKLAAALFGCRWKNTRAMRKKKRGGKERKRKMGRANHEKEDNIRENYEKRTRSRGQRSPGGPLLAQLSTMKW